MWIAQGSSYWVETGDTAGANQSDNYYHGSFSAYQSTSGYQEFDMNNGCPQNVTYKIYDNNGSWYVYVNGTAMIYYNMQPSFNPNYMEVGIESDDTGNIFDNGLQDKNLNYYDSVGTAHAWSSSSEQNGDNNNLGWYSSYTGGSSNYLSFYGSKSQLSAISNLITGNVSMQTQNKIPVFEANNNAPDSSLKTATEILSIANSNLPTSASIKSTERRTWSEHIKNDEPNSDFKDFQISPDRQVYVVKTSFPDGINTRAGFYASATLMTTYDAATGDTLESFVTGNYKGK
jgi:hypothetical protein